MTTLIFRSGMINCLEKILGYIQSVVCLEL